MQFLKKTIGFVAVLGTLPGAYAVTARPSVIGTASSRMPTMTAKISTSGGTSSSTSTSTLLANAECIEAYTDCLKGGDVCGSNFEECTNNTLFYSKKPQCSSVLMQCAASGVTALFGTNNQTAFSNKNSDGEYIYPTAGSVLGQMIEAAHISNRYDTSSCVRRYTSCLTKDDVCGADFELCTTNTEFKKQKLFCESTLARCQSDGIKELFGTTNTSANPTGDSRIGILINEGAALAAVNAVATCYKVADQCILNACSTNPYKCKEGASQEIVKITETVNSGDGTVVTTETETSLGAINRKDVSGFIKNSCLSTIGANKYCYATFVGNGVMPTNAQLRDADNQDTVYSEAYSSRMNDSMKAKIDELIEKFDKKVKTRCADSIVSCAMRSCGQGSGAACYASAFDKNNKIQGVTNPSTLADIKAGCEAIVNNDTACQYAAATFDMSTGAFLFEETSLFDKLFTTPNDIDVKNPDAVGAVATLNAKLSTSYNQAALDGMKRQCQAVAQSCVKSMCGADYVNCYRNRTDVSSTLTKTESESFNKSMNKVGGVLDHTIVLGLCMNTVKNTPICEEHIKAEAARSVAGTSSADSWGASWGVTDARSGWLDAGTYSANDQVQDTDADGNLLCQTQQNGGDYGRCDDNSGMYVYPKMVSSGTYKLAQVERTVFRDLIYDLEIEAQAKYNAKLTQEQNMCLAANNGGIVGNKDMSSTFMWAKLKSNKVPKEYNVAGLKSTQFVASNDLYGSFCRVRVTLQSDDKRIQDKLREGSEWATAYFAVGDAFTCGSWIPSADLEELADAVATDATASKRSSYGRTRDWMTILGVVGGGIGGGYLTDSLQKGDFLGGLLGRQNTGNNSNNKSDAQNCVTHAKNAKYYIDNIGASNSMLISGEIAVAKKFASSANVIDITIDNCVQDVQNGVVTNYCTNKTGVQTQLDTLIAACNRADSTNDADKDSDKERKSRAITNIVGGVVTATASGFLINKAVRDIQASSLDNAYKTAYEEWMNSVGRHIRCFIGADEVGTYGDIISVTLD